MPGPKVPWDFRMKDGSVVHGVSVSAVGPPIVDLVTGMYIGTCANNMNLSMVTDTHYFDDIDEFMDLFKKCLLDFMYPEKAKTVETVGGQTRSVSKM